jgi:hypothetical protein
MVTLRQTTANGIVVGQKVIEIVGNDLPLIGLIAWQEWK